MNLKNIHLKAFKNKFKVALFRKKEKSRKHLDFIRELFSVVLILKLVLILLAILIFCFVYFQ